MVKEELRKKVAEAGYEVTIFYDSPSFDDSIIGIDHNGKAVYSYDFMADEYVKDEHPEINFIDSEEYFEALQEAYEWIDYNTVRATPYMGLCQPVIVALNPETEKLENVVTMEEYDLDNVDIDIQVEDFKVCNLIGE